MTKENTQCALHFHLGEKREEGSGGLSSNNQVHGTAFSSSSSSTSSSTSTNEKAQQPLLEYLGGREGGLKDGHGPLQPKQPPQSIAELPSPLALRYDRAARSGYKERHPQQGRMVAWPL